VISYHPFVAQEVMNRAGVERVDFDELLSVSDFISIHAPLLRETKGLFDAGTFRKMKSAAFLINTARGPIVDEEALARALDEGRLAGAALDVLSQEPPSRSPLCGRDNVILTPHTSFYSAESLVELQRKATEDVVRVLRGETPFYPLNPEVLKSRQEPSAALNR
jgi:D-3-phosphoglycerate dehydrogenase